MYQTSFMILLVLARKGSKFKSNKNHCLVVNTGSGYKRLIGNGVLNHWTIISLSSTNFCASVLPCKIETSINVL